MKKKLLGAAFLWLVVIGISLYWNISTTRSNQTALILQTARALVDQLVITRQWNSSFNGVYVTVSDTVKPNIYLKDPKRDLSCEGILLTKINPSYMSRQISELTQKNQGIAYHMTGLHPLRPENKPDPWEKNALETFSKEGTLEKGEMISDEPEPFFMYMKALKANATCLACHTGKGYVPNDVIGGISIKIYTPPKADYFPIVASRLIVGGLGLLIIFVFGFSLIKAYETIHRQAFFDGLTNIPNRRYFNTRTDMDMGQARRQGTPISILMADVDNFKAYNDFYGHSRGDEVLIQVAQTLKTALQRPLDFCARYGGEEFVVVLPDTGVSGAVRVAQRIIQQLETLKIPHKASQTSDHVTLSIGISSEKGAAANTEQMIKHADDALYRAKAQGKNQYEHV